MDQSWIGRDDHTDRAWAEMEGGGHITKVDFMWDVITQREVQSSNVNFMWEK